MISFIKVFCFKEFEDRQLLWEQHEVELERSIAKLEKQQRDVMEAAQKVLFLKNWPHFWDGTLLKITAGQSVIDRRKSVCDCRKTSLNLNGSLDRQYLNVTTTFTNFDSFTISSKNIFRYTF